MARIKKKKAKSNPLPTRSRIEARILIVEFESLPSGVRALVLASENTDSPNVNRAKRRLKIRGGYKVAAAVITHRRIAPLAYQRLLEALPTFAFGSTDFLVRASVDRIERTFLEVIGQDPAHFEYTLRTMQEELNLIRHKLEAVSKEKRELEDQLEAAQSALNTKDVEIQECKVKLEKAWQRAEESQQRARVAEWKEEYKTEARERERYWDPSRAWPDEDPDPWRIK